MPDDAASDERSAAGVDDLFGFELEILKRLDKSLPHADIARVAALYPEQVREHEPTGEAFGYLVLNRGVKAQKENLEIPPIRGLRPPADPAGVKARRGRERGDSRDQTDANARASIGNRTRSRSSTLRPLGSLETVTGVRTPRMVSAFSRDIAGSRSPTASRASAWLR